MDARDYEDAYLREEAEKQEPNCGHESCDCRGYCKKQEPVKNEPVALVAFNLPSNINFLCDRGLLLHGTKLYTRPQDLTAEVERLRKAYNNRTDEALKMQQRWNDALERIAALEEAAREARDALQYKLHVVEAIAKLNAVLGNA